MLEVESGNGIHAEFIVCHSFNVTGVAVTVESVITEVDVVFILKRFVSRADHFQAVRRSEDLDVQIARDLTDGFPDFFLYGVVYAVFHLVDEEIVGLVGHHDYQEMKEAICAFSHQTQRHLLSVKRCPYHSLTIW